MDYQISEFGLVKLETIPPRYIVPTNGWKDLEPAWVLFGVPQSLAVSSFLDLLVSLEPEAFGHAAVCAHTLWKIDVTDHVSLLSASWMRIFMPGTRCGV